MAVDYPCRCKCWWTSLISPCYHELVNDINGGYIFLIFHLMWNVADGWCIFLLLLLLFPFSTPLCHCVIDFECIFIFKFLSKSSFLSLTFTQTYLKSCSFVARWLWLLLNVHCLQSALDSVLEREMIRTFRKFYFNESGRPQFKMHSFSDQISIPDRPIIPSPARDLVRRQQPPPSTTDNLLKPPHHHHNN